MHEPPRVLIADDDVLLRMADTRVLREAGYQVIEASDGLEALRLAHQHHPDLILLDVMMGDPDGFTVCQRIKSDPELSTAFVVMFSGMAITSNDRSKGLSDGADEYIVRPIAHKELKARIHAFLRTKQAQDALRESEASLRTMVENLAWESSVNAALARLAEALIDPARSIQDIAQATLDSARELTHSQDGFVSSIDPISGDNVAHAFTGLMANDQFTSEHQQVVLQRSPSGQYSGLWGHALNTCQAFFSNTPAVHPASQPIPPAHPEMVNFLTAPACIGEQVVGQVTLANAPDGYHPPQLQAVQRLAQLYALAVQRWQQESALYNREAQLRSLVNQSMDGIALTDQRGHVIEWNQGMEKLTGYDRGSVVGRPLWEVQFDMGLPEQQTEAAARQLAQMIQQALATGKTPWPGIMNQRTLYRKDGTVCHVEGTVFPIQVEQGTILGSILHDVTHLIEAEQRLKTTLAEKETLLKEVHHRVKNNLQVVTSLLSIQAQMVNHPAVRDALLENKTRIRSIAAVHERLYRSRDLAHIEMSLYLEEMVFDLRNVYSAGDIQVTIQAEGVTLSVDQAIPCGLLVNELISNAMKYAFGGLSKAGQGSKSISIFMETRPEAEILLEIADNGAGLPSGYDPYESKTLGLQLVNMLSRQLRGALEIESAPGQGARFRLVFPAQG